MKTEFNGEFPYSIKEPNEQFHLKKVVNNFYFYIKCTSFQILLLYEYYVISQLCSVPLWLMPFPL